MNDETPAPQAPLFPWPVVVLFAAFLGLAVYWRFAVPARPDYLDRPAPRGYELLMGSATPTPAPPPPARVARPARSAPPAERSPLPRASVDPLAPFYVSPGEGPVAESGPGGVSWADRYPKSNIVYISNASDAPPPPRAAEDDAPSAPPSRRSEDAPSRPAGPRTNDPNEERFEAPGQYR